MVAIRTARERQLKHARLTQLFSYDPETGIFVRLLTNLKAGVGSRAGHLCRNGYRVITIKRVVYLEHRLAWFYVHRVWPRQCIDHINQIKDDNRLCNLREATQSQNRGNTRLLPNNTSGYRGVTFYKPTKRFQARIRRHGHLYSLGYFKTAAEAGAVAAEARRAYFGEFAPEHGSHTKDPRP